MLSAAGRIQSVRGPDGQLGVTHSRVVHLVICGHRQSVCRYRHLHIALSSDRIEILDVQFGRRRSMYRHSFAANRRRGRLLHWHLF